MLKNALIFIFIVIAAYSAAFAQTVYTPEKGSAERKAILDALRAPVEKELKQKIVFAKSVLGKLTVFFKSKGLVI